MLYIYAVIRYYWIQSLELLVTLLSTYGTISQSPNIMNDGLFLEQVKPASLSLFLL